MKRYQMKCLLCVLIVFLLGYHFDRIMNYIVGKEGVTNTGTTTKPKPKPGTGTAKPGRVNPSARTPNRTPTQTPNRTPTQTPNRTPNRTPTQTPNRILQKKLQRADAGELVKIEEEIVNILEEEGDNGEEILALQTAATAITDAQIAYDNAVDNQTSAIDAGVDGAEYGGWLSSDFAINLPTVLTPAQKYNIYINMVLGGAINAADDALTSATIELAMLESYYGGYGDSVFDSLSATLDFQSSEGDETDTGITYADFEAANLGEGP